MRYVTEKLGRNISQAKDQRARKSLRGISKALKRLTIGFLPKLDWAIESKGEGVTVITHFDSLGDSILFSPVVRSTALTFQNTRIVLVTLSERKVLYENCPFVQNVYGLTPHRWMSPQTRHYFLMLGTYFLLLFKFPGQIKRIIGPSWLLFEDWSEFGRDLLHNKLQPQSRFAVAIDQLPVYEQVDKQHQVKRMLSLAKVFGVEEFGSYLEVWLNKSPNIHTDNPARLAVMLGSSHPRRSWPTDRYITVIKEVLEEFHNISISLFGQSDFIPNFDLLEELASFPRVNNYVDETDLVNLASRLDGTGLVIGNDTGTMHLAAALGIPCIVISSHSKTAESWSLHSPNRYHPWNTLYEVIQPETSPLFCSDTCSSENAHCILEVSTLMVKSSASKYLYKV